MLIERTLTQLQADTATPERARELAHMGYMQWLFWLPSHASYTHEAKRVLDAAKGISATDPAVAVFCDLVRASLARPGMALDITLPRPRRRGGAKSRRKAF